ncbi:MAG: DUF4430 domain-containing protein, partial [Bacillota bacterium]|nr:DUF4430 domain-containing protein [Bacillota bacterium]
MQRRKTNVFIAWIFLVSLIGSGFQTHAFAANIAKAGTITVVRSETAGELLPETTVPYVDKETALDALVKTVGAANIDIEDTQYGKSIKRIKGLTKADPYYWAFYVNGIFAQVNYDAYVVQPGDKLSFVYTDWNKAPEKTVSIKVIGKDGKELFKPLSQVAFIGQPNAFQLLQSAVGAENVGYNQYNFGKMITSINGVQAQGSDYWGFNVNGKMATVGPDSYQLQNGDEISFSYAASASPTNPNGSADGKKTHAAPFSAYVLNKSVESGMQYALKHPLGEWEAIALKQAGKRIPVSYLDGVKKLVKEKKGKFAKITDYERYALGILAAGGNPVNVDGYNLIASIYNGEV